MDQPDNHILLRSNQPGAADRMRELLARTVQDHVSDQQSNAGALEDIRQRTEGLEWLVKEGLDVLRAQDERLTKLQHSLGQLQQHMETAAGRFSRLDKALETMTERLDQRLAGTDARVTALDARLERLDERLDDQYDRVAAIDNTLAATDAKLGAVDTRLADELRSRPGPAEITAAVATIVDAAQQDVTAHLSSLEETVLTLAEALLRPPARAVPAARAGARSGLG